MKKILDAIRFLTIIPVPSLKEAGSSGIAESTSAFVLVGMLQGGMLIVVNYVAGIFLGDALTVGIVLLFAVLHNGGFHCDGLADTFDALAARGDTSRRLAVMKDGRIGPIGTLALFFSLLIKFLALYEISVFQPELILPTLFLMPVFSKWAMVLSMFYGVPASPEGMGKVFVERTGAREFRISTCTLCLAVPLLLAIPGDHPIRERSFFYGLTSISVYLFSRQSVFFFRKHFGGVTGDTLGAVGELTEILFLLVAAAWPQIIVW